MLLGLSLALCSGICLGLLLTPMRKLQGWEWENFWAVWSIVGLLLGPIAVAAAVIPHPFEVFSGIGFRLVALTLVLGALGGTSGFLYSMTIPALGVGLAAALNAGSAMATSLLPLAVVHSNTIWRRSGLLTITGICIAIAGMGICTKAGSLREQETVDRNVSRAGGMARGSFAKGVVLCLLSGFISSLGLLGLAFPNRIIEIAQKFGSSDFGANYAFLGPFMVGGFFSNFLYVARRLRTNKTFPRFFGPHTMRCVGWSSFSAVLFVAGMTTYAGGVAVLGSFGGVVVWGNSMAATILSSSLWDISNKEWRGRPVRVMAAGVGVLLGAIVLLGLAQYFHQLDVGH
jgi:L-rhamnose-H+ transport protein